MLQTSQWKSGDTGDCVCVSQRKFLELSKASKRSYFWLLCTFPKKFSLGWHGGGSSFFWHQLGILTARRRLKTIWKQQWTKDRLCGQHQLSLACAWGLGVIWSHYLQTSVSHTKDTSVDSHRREITNDVFVQAAKKSYSVCSRDKRQLSPGTSAILRLSISVK